MQLLTHCALQLSIVACRASEMLSGECCQSGIFSRVSHAESKSPAAQQS